MPDLRMTTADGVVSAQIRILKKHVGVTAIDMWADSDHNGRPDSFLARVKYPGERENQPTPLGNAPDIDEKVVQLVWMPSQPSQSTDGWEVEIDLRQAGQSLVGMPMRLAGSYPKNRRYGLYETWFRLVKG